MSYVDLSISASNFSDTDVANIITDKLWTEDNIEPLATRICDEASNEGQMDELKKLAEKILEIINA